MGLKRLCFALTTFFLLLFSLPVKAIEVTAEGIGITYEEALKKAQRNAIEKALGVAIISKTKVKNFTLIESKISKFSKGLLKSYEVIDKTKDDSLWRVTIRADVSDNEIRDFFKDPAMRKFFQDLCFNKRKVRVYYDPERNPYALPPDSLPAQTVLTTLKGWLTDLLFDVTVETAHKRNPLKYNYDVVVYALVSKEVKPMGYTNLVTVKLTLKAIDEVSQHVLTTVDLKKSVFYNGEPTEAFLDTMVKKLLNKGLHQLIAKIVENLSERGCINYYYLVFEDLPPEQLWNLMDILNNLNVDYELKDQTEDKVIFEVRSDASKNDLLRRLYFVFKNAPFKVFPKKITDTTIVLGIKN